MVAIASWEEIKISFNWPVTVGMASLDKRLNNDSRFFLDEIKFFCSCDFSEFENENFSS